MVFLHPTTVAALRAYDRRARDQAFPEAEAPTLPRQQPAARRWTAATPPHVRRARHDGRHQGTRPGSVARGLHDLRHVVHGRDAAGLVPRRRRRRRPGSRVLSTWLGHVDPKSTYWYLSAVPRAARPGRRPARARRAETGRHRDPTSPRSCRAFFTDRLTRQQTGQPAHRRRLPRHLPAAARLRPAHAPATRPASSDLADLDATADRRRSCTTWRASGATERHPQRPPGRDPLAVPYAALQRTRARRA